MRPMISLPLTKMRLQNRLKRIEDYIKVDFLKVSFTDEFCVAFDGLDG